MITSGYFPGADGVRLFYRGWICERPKALVILIHGAGEHSGRYAHIGEICMQNGIALAAPDLRGFGRSEGPRGHVNSFREYLNDLEIFLQWWEKRFPSVPRFLMGHSFGGLIVIRHGQTFSRKVHGVILSSPALGLRFRLPFPVQNLLRLISWVTPGFSITPYKWSETLKKIDRFKPFFPEKFTVEILKDPLSTIEYTPRWLTELINNGIHALSEAARFRFPTLCFYDRKDPIIHPDAVRRFLDSLTVPDKKYVAFNEGRHRPWHQGYSEQAVDNFMNWLHSRL